MPAAAQQGETVVDISDCVGLEGREQRECYEQRVQAVLQSQDEGGSNDVEQESANRRTPTATTETREATRREPAGDSTRRNESDEIVSRVVSLRELEPNNWLVELENGQVWRQNRPKRYKLREGADVVLRGTRWGTSYRLTDPNLGSFIQVERVR